MTEIVGTKLPLHTTFHLVTATTMPTVVGRIMDLPEIPRHYENDPGYGVPEPLHFTVSAGLAYILWNVGARLTRDFIMSQIKVSQVVADASRQFPASLLKTEMQDWTLSHLGDHAPVLVIQVEGLPITGLISYDKTEWCISRSYDNSARSYETLSQLLDSVGTPGQVALDPEVRRAILTAAGRQS